MNLSTRQKQTHRHRERTYGHRGEGEGWGEGHIGSWKRASLGADGDAAVLTVAVVSRVHTSIKVHQTVHLEYT